MNSMQTILTLWVSRVIGHVAPIKPSPHVHIDELFKGRVSSTKMLWRAVEAFRELVAIMGDKEEYMPYLLIPLSSSRRLVTRPPRDMQAVAADMDVYEPPSLNICSRESFKYLCLRPAEKYQCPLPSHFLGLTIPGVQNWYHVCWDPTEKRYARSISADYYCRKYIGR